MRLTLVKTMLVAGSMPLLLAAQVPPAGQPPRPPAERPNLPPAPPLLPLEAALAPLLDLRLELEPMWPIIEDARRVELDAMRAGLEHMHVGHELALRADEMRLIRDEAHVHAMELASAELDAHRVGIESLREDSFLKALPRQSWAPQDPADSLYRVAREALNRGEYRRAAQIFNDVTRKHPTSRYAMDSAYWEAFARYRLGSTDELRLALSILEGRGPVKLDAEAMMRQGREGSSHAIDIQALRTRVQGALAARGDERAAEALRRNASQQGGCDREEVSVRAEALSALGQMDAAAARPVIQKVLERRDECTVELRRRALYLLGRQGDSGAVSLILDVAKNDPDANIRGEAMRWLPRVAGDAAVPQLEEILRSSADERTQRSAVIALATIDSDRARRAVRAIIERTDAAERVRYDAIVSLAREREGRSASADDLTYLRALYGKLETTRLKEAALTAISRVPTPENQQFLVAIIRNTAEPSSLRAAAVQRLGRMDAVSATEIAKLYDVADARSLREQILHALSQRKEPEGIDKMIDVAKRDTDPDIRRTAINLLGRAAANGNERAKKFLQEFWDR